MKRRRDERSDRLYFTSYLDAAFSMSRNSFISALNVEKGSQSHRATDEPISEYNRNGAMQVRENEIV